MFLNQLEFVRAKADQLNEYYYFAGEADYFQKDLDRYRAVTADDVKHVVPKYLLAPRVTLHCAVRQERKWVLQSRRPFNEVL